MTVEIKRSRHSREYVKLELTTTPPVTAWDITFDDGATWHALTPVPGEDGYYRLLVAGSSAAQGTAPVSLPPRAYTITARGTDNPEIVARNIGTLSIQ